MVTFTQELFDKVCERIAKGESLRSICRDPDMPAQVTVFKWIGNNEELAKQYARAREAQADAIFDEILDIADNSTNDWMEKHGQESVGWQLNGDSVQRARLMIDARKWMAGKLRPKVYGEKVGIEGPGEGGAIVIQWKNADD